MKATPVLKPYLLEVYESVLAAGQREFPLTGCEPPGRPLTWGSRRWGQ